jgi:hypothetical protein
MKKIKKLALLFALVVAFVVMFSGCQNGQLDQLLVINTDFSGSRTMSMYLQAFPGVDNDQPDYCVPYYWLTKHGDDLRQYLEETYENYYGTETYEYLGPTFEVDRSTLVPDPQDDRLYTDGYEIIRISFEFDDFEDYVNKMWLLANFNGGIKDPVPDTPEGQLSWRYSESGTVNDSFYNHPTLTYKDGELYYREEGIVAKFIYQALWDYMVLDDEYNETTNPDGVFKRTGTHPNVTYNESIFNIRHGGSKVRAFDINLCGTTVRLKNNVQLSTNYSFDVIEVELLGADAGLEFTGIDVTGNSQIVTSASQLRDLEISVNYKGGDFDQSETKWYRATYDSTTSTYTVEEQVHTGQTYTVEVTDFGTQYFCVSNKGIRTFMAAESVHADHIVTFKENGNVLQQIPVNTGGTVTLSSLDFARSGYRYTFSHEQNALTNISQDIEVTVTYVKVWNVTFVANDEIITTVVVDDGTAVPSSQIPTAPQVEGKVFKEWDAPLNNITEDTIINAVYEDAPQPTPPPESKGCKTSAEIPLILLLSGCLVVCSTRLSYKKGGK